jgi:hypothetical protein
MQTLQVELQGQGLNVPDGAIYAGGLDERMPDACIFMVTTGGVEPTDQMGGNESIQHPVIQVRIRHDDKALGQSDADDVWQILHDADLTDYAPTRMQQSDALYLGQDDDARHDWSVNVELFIYE